MKLTELFTEKELSMLNTLLWCKEEDLYRVIVDLTDSGTRGQIDALLSQYKAIRVKLIEAWQQERCYPEQD